MNLSRLRLITFDVTDTLLKFRTSPGKQYGEIGAMYGVLCDNGLLSSSFKTHWFKMNKDHPNFGLKTGLGWENWWKMIISGTFKDSNFKLNDKQLDAISSHLIEVYKTTTCWQPCHGALDLLSYLRDKDLTLGVISNFDPRLEEILVNTKLRHHFKFVVTSYNVGLIKPNACIFTKAMEMSGLKNLNPEQCLHIGDKASLDYMGAKNRGWHGILIDERSPDKIKEKYPEVDPDHIFANLYDLHKHFMSGDGEQEQTDDKDDDEVKFSKNY